ncbi:hypothetical protein BC938DRAFT_476956 [Jimgerdemannia flammicorona]|uniref:Uncharacterized protein n=1 Tax=Jimgerdemannia flammicorona TaxID=994334 RepID=A0A433QYZ4_9FUNG|nr:hypothetical protein BC938DRAFT_476956 [Jimgerdemannia flammicorona]
MEVADENVNVKGGMNDQYRCIDGFQLGSQGGTRTSARLPRSSAASPSPHALAPRAPVPRAPAPRAPAPRAPAPRAPAPRAPAPRAPTPRAPAPRAPAPRAPAPRAPAPRAPAPRAPAPPYRALCAFPSCAPASIAFLALLLHGNDFPLLDEDEALANGGRDARTGRHLGAASGVRRYGSRPGDIGGRWGDSDR